jgi:hypothetical protein
VQPCAIRVSVRVREGEGERAALRNSNHTYIKNDKRFSLAALAAEPLTLTLTLTLAASLRSPAGCLHPNPNSNPNPDVFALTSGMPSPCSGNVPPPRDALRSISALCDRGGIGSGTSVTKDKVDLRPE